MSLAGDAMDFLVTDRSAAEPLVFRSLDDARGSVSESVRQKAEAVPAPHPFDLEASLQAARVQGRQEAWDELSGSVEQRIQDERDAIGRTLRRFEDEKERYFADVEGEVVKLSLAIAERVLRREAAMDPMFLAGAARVALEQVADASNIVLRVAPEDADHWAEMMASEPKSLVIEPDEGMLRGECVLKTRSGTVQLGLRAQLQEIERGFFELLARRPSVLFAGDQASA